MEHIRGENINRVKEMALRRKTRIFGFIGPRNVENLFKWEEFFREEYGEDEWWFEWLVSDC